MQLRDLALSVEQDRSGAGSRGPRLGELSFEFCGTAGKGRIDDVFERQRRGIGHHGDDVVDADLAAAAGIERELVDLVARGGAVAAEQRDQQSARVGRQRQPGRAHLVVDQAGRDLSRCRHSTVAPRHSWRVRRDCAAAHCGANRRLRSPRGIRRRLRPAALRPRARCCGRRPSAIPRGARRTAEWSAPPRRAATDRQLTSSPSSRASANGSPGSSTEALMRALTRSLTRPASGPNTSTTGRPGSGRATKPSTSAALTATMGRS